MNVSMTRRVSFSSGHRYHFEQMTDAENEVLFPGFWSRYNHGHNYILDVTVEGDIDDQTGMIVNISEVDKVLKRVVVSRFNNRSINDEIPEFKHTAPCLENLLSYFWSVIENAPLPKEATLKHLRLYEMPTLFAERDAMKTTLTRTYEFAASHRLHAPALSDEQNLELFGKCNNPAGHGHNYVLEVTVTGEPHPTTGMITSLQDLDQTVNEQVVDRYDHKNLNVDIPEFQGVPTTSEIVAKTIYQRLNSALGDALHSVKLHETARNSFEVSKS
ncbi:MAG TPA: 6-carboxytetrahydropterin synthase [Fimbriimonas sp.]|nr:6-carboxytetrahydropterin synthase [Fimbriimonas sp.]